MCNVGALVIRIGFWDIFCYNEKAQGPIKRHLPCFLIACAMAAQTDVAAMVGELEMLIGTFDRRWFAKYCIEVHSVEKTERTWWHDQFHDQMQPIGNQLAKHTLTLLWQQGAS